MYSISLISLSINLNSKHFLRIKPYQSTYYPRTRPFLAIKSPLSPLISLSWSKSKSIVGERDPEQTVKPQTFHIPDSRTNLRDACDVLTEEEQSARTTMAWRSQHGGFGLRFPSLIFHGSTNASPTLDSRLLTFPICLSACSMPSLLEFSWKLIVKWKLFEIESFGNHLEWICEYI